MNDSRDKSDLYQRSKTRLELSLVKELNKVPGLKSATRGRNNGIIKGPDIDVPHLWPIVEYGESVKLEETLEKYCDRGNQNRKIIAICKRPGISTKIAMRFDSFIELLIELEFWK